MPLKFDQLKPTVIPGNRLRDIVEGARAVNMTGEEQADTNIGSTSSFFYDPPLLGLKSTQQLNVDWTRFENHTFFNSAEVNVNVAFDQIINSFPFDGTRREAEQFFEKLTGFEKHVYDVFPKNVGFLFFSGTLPGEDTDATKGTWIRVNDYAGGLLPDLSKTKTGKSILDPESGNSFTIELHLFVPAQSNAGQVVCQKMSTMTSGFSLCVLSSSNTASCPLQFTVVSGSTSLYVTASIPKGQFSHVAAVLDRQQRRAFFYRDAQLVSVTTQSVNIGAMDIKSAPFLVGSGSAFSFEGITFTPAVTLSGAIDELRFFHEARTQTQLEKHAKKSVFSTPELKLYYKFNEPTGTLGSTSTDSLNRLVLDSSGNSLHAYISEQSFTGLLRSTGSVAVPMTHEKLTLSPVLFPYFADVVSLNERLLASATFYDSVNPNLISKLVPSHYFLEGQEFDGLETEQGTINETYTGTGAPGSGQLGTTQLMLTFLYTWAKFFDELKLFVDSFSTLHYVDYNATNTAPDHFLPILLKQFGFSVPSFFIDSSIEQFVDAENIRPVISTDTYSLQYIQNQILRRVLSNMLDIVKSKGTLHSVKAFIRAVGIDPDNSFRIREFGGPTKQQLLHSRETRTEPGFLLDFTGSVATVTSPFLSSSRLERGFPEPIGTMVLPTVFPPHGVSNNVSDGLLTSGSWTFEAVYRWPTIRALSSLTQCLARLQTTGSLSTSPFCTFSLVAMSASSDIDNYGPRLKLFARPTSGSDLARCPLLTLQLSGCNVFDGKKWNVSFGRVRGDSISSATSSYFLRAATAEAGEIRQIWTTSSFFLEGGTLPAENRSLDSVNSSFNASGSFFVVGSGTLSTASMFLNDSALVSPEARAVSFNGQVARLRFWSKDITETEWKEHVRNYRSVGVANPLKNFLFERVASGSWERLRIDASMDQDTRDVSSDGTIRLFDYTQNNMHLSGTNFAANSRVIVSDLWSYSLISPSFDEASTSDKVRIRSLLSLDNVNKSYYTAVAPLHRLVPSEEPFDDTRFSIEFSVIDALNRDMVSIFSTLELLDNVLGSPELVFSPDYPGLELLRNIYFNRLTDKVNIKSFFEFFRWFDGSIGSFIEHLIPHKTRFFGTNFVVESHMFERPKLEYSFSDIYLSEATRHNMKDVLLLQQIVGTVKKF